MNEETFAAVCPGCGRNRPLDLQLCGHCADRWNTMFSGIQYDHRYTWEENESRAKNSFKVEADLFQSIGVVRGLRFNQEKTFTDKDFVWANDNTGAGSCICEYSHQNPVSGSLQIIDEKEVVKKLENENKQISEERDRWKDHCKMLVRKRAKLIEAIDNVRETLQKLNGDLSIDLGLMQLGWNQNGELIEDWPVKEKSVSFGKVHRFDQFEKRCADCHFNFNDYEDRLEGWDKPCPGKVICWNCGVDMGEESWWEGRKQEGDKIVHVQRMCRSCCDKMLASEK